MVAMRILLLSLLCSVAAADTITWTPPSTTLNGSPLPRSEIAGGYVQVDNCSGKVEMLIPYGPRTAGKSNINPAPGVHCWSVAVTTVDGGFNISAPVPHTENCPVGQVCRQSCH